MVQKTESYKWHRDLVAILRPNCDVVYRMPFILSLIKNGTNASQISYVRVTMDGGKNAPCTVASPLPGPFQKHHFKTKSIDDCKQ